MEGRGFRGEVPYDQGILSFGFEPAGSVPLVLGWVGRTGVGFVGIPCWSGIEADIGVGLPVCIVVARNIEVENCLCLVEKLYKQGLDIE